MTTSHKKTKSLRIGVGLLLSAMLLLGLVVAIYFWQIRLQKPEEINMAGHMHHMETAMSAMHTGYEGISSNLGSCENLTALDSDAPVHRFDVTAARKPLILDNGKTADAWTFNGSSPGPVIRVTEGDRVIVTLHNQDIDEGVTIHWHGVIVPCSQDGVAGVTQDAVKPGQQFTYEFIASAPGTYWYHSHQMSSIQAEKGLLGQFIVDSKSESYSITQDIAALMQKLDSTYLINGKTEGLTMPGEPGDRVRLRLTNAANDTMEMLVDGAPYKIIAMDGHSIHDPGLIDGKGFNIGAGQRYDLLITLPTQGKVIVRSKAEDRLRVSIGSGKDPNETTNEEIFSFVDYGSALSDDKVEKLIFDQTFELKLGQNMFLNTINGQSFHHIPPLIVKKNEHIKFTITNEGGGDHPFHMHGHVFRVLSKNGEKLKGSPIYLDTILTQKNDTYELYLIADNPGLWMAHCHNLMHASIGMSMMLNYEGITTPYRVGTKSGNLPDL
ncbi:MAG: multicopper oxidase family protein [Candidatus Pristimantibacillus sp.]